MTRLSRRAPTVTDVGGDASRDAVRELAAKAGFDVSIVAAVPCSGGQAAAITGEVFVGGGRRGGFAAKVVLTDRITRDAPETLPGVTGCDGAPRTEAAVVALRRELDAMAQAGAGDAPPLAPRILAASERAAIWERVPAPSYEDHFALRSPRTGADPRTFAGLGRTLAAVHALPGRHGAGHDVAAATIAAGLRPRTAAAIEDHRGHVPGAVTELLDTLLDEIASAAWTTARVPSHGDPSFGNAWSLSDDRTVLTDWEHADARPALHDLTVVQSNLLLQAFNPLRQDSTVRAMNDAFWDGYAAPATQRRTAVAAAVVWVISSFVARKTGGRLGWARSRYLGARLRTMSTIAGHAAR